MVEARSLAAHATGWLTGRGKHLAPRIAIPPTLEAWNRYDENADLTGEMIVPPGCRLLLRRRRDCACAKTFCHDLHRFSQIFPFDLLRRADGGPGELAANFTTKFLGASGRSVLN